MDNLIAVIAGGVHEVKKMLSKQARHNKWSSQVCFAISGICLFSAIYCAYQSYENRKLEKENKDAQETLHLRRMPSLKAEEMGT